MSQRRHRLCTTLLSSKAMRERVLLSSVKRYEMTVMSKEQTKRDERSLIIFLILFNIALAGAFLLACFYQS
jgi:hypothetical protein